MFVNTREQVQETIAAAKIFYARKSLSVFLLQYMKGKDVSSDIKMLDYLMSLVETLELSLVIKGLNMTPIGSKVRRIAGPLVAAGANQIPPMEIITAETVFAPDGLYGLGRFYYDKNVLTESIGCPTGSLKRFNALRAETEEDTIRGDTTSDVISGE